MRLRLRSVDLAIAVVAMLPALGTSRAGADVRVEGTRVVAETHTLRAVLEQGTLVSLRNRLTGKEMLAPGPALEAGGYLAGGKVEPAGGECQAEVRDGAAIVTRSGPAGAWRLSVRVDSDDLLLEAEASAAQPGVAAARIALAGPDWRRLQLAAPISAQGMVVREPAPGTRTRFHYCGHRDWEAQILLFEPRAPGGGGFTLWAEDRRVVPKAFEARREASGGWMALESESPGAPARNSTVEGVTWRLSAFAGDWRAPVARYRRWMRAAFLPSGWTPPEWAGRIGAFVTIQSLDPKLLPALAKQVDPSQTLLVLVQWRREGYDRNYPDYTAAEGFEAFCRQAHALGFRVMVHFNTFACWPGHPAFERVRSAALRDRRGNPCGYFLDNPQHPMHFLHIHPGCAAFREMLVAAARNVAQRYGVDAVHLDQSLVIENHAGGLVEGLTVGEGKLRLIREMLEACPGLALGGEELNEGTLAVSFTQRTPHDDEVRSQHPIGFFLFGPSVRYYSHYAFTIPGTAANSEAADILRTQERSGITPTFSASGAEGLGRPGALTVARIAREFQKRGLRPDTERPWPAGARFCWGTSDGRQWPVLPTAGGARLAAGTNVVYERRSGLDTLKTAGSVAGWPAFGKGWISGLDPTQQYLLSPEPPPERVPRFARIVEAQTLARWQISPDLVWADLEVNRRRAALVRLADCAGEMRTGVLVQGIREGPLGYRAAFQRQLVACGGARREGFFAHPPWERVDRWGQVFAEFDVQLPASSTGLYLDWLAGIADGAQDTDGTTFLVTVDGKEVFREHNGTEGWHPMLADLTAYAGKRVRLRLITDPGPKHNTSWDLTAWGDPIVRRGSVPAPLSVLLPEGSGPLRALDGNGRDLPITRAGKEAVVSLAAPGSVLLRRTPGETVALPLDLLAGAPHEGGGAGSPVPRPSSSVPFRVGQVSRGEWRPTPEIGGRADRHCGGGVRVGSVGAHPPGCGQTTFQYLLKLPKREGMTLDLGYGVCGSFTKGVSFQVAVNRRTIWRDDMPTATYRESSVSLAPFAGQDVLLELVTDSLGDAGFDWAIWGRALLR